MRSLLALSLLMAAAVGAEPLPRRQFKLEARDEPVRSLVRRIQGEAGAPCRVAPELADQRLSFNISITTTGDPQVAILRYVAGKLGETRNGVTVVREADGFAMVLLPVTEHPREPVRAAPVDPRLPPRVAAPPGGTRLRQAFRHYLGPEVRLEVEPSIPDIPLALSHPPLPAQEGLLKLLVAAQDAIPEVRLERDRGVYHVAAQRRPPPAPNLVERLRGIKVSAEVKDEPFRTAIGRVLQGTGLRCIVHTNIPADVKVSASLKDQSLLDALTRLTEALARRLPGASLGFSRDIIVFERRRAELLSP
jgi:hypothetical protein